MNVTQMSPDLSSPSREVGSDPSGFEGRVRRELMMQVSVCSGCPICCSMLQFKGVKLKNGINIG